MSALARFGSGRKRYSRLSLLGKAYTRIEPRITDIGKKVSEECKGGRKQQSDEREIKIVAHNCIEDGFPHAAPAKHCLGNQCAGKQAAETEGDDLVGMGQARRFCISHGQKAEFIPIIGETHTGAAGELDGWGQAARAACVAAGLTQSPVSSVADEPFAGWLGDKKRQLEPDQLTDIARNLSIELPEISVEDFYTIMKKKTFP